ncbi:MAG: gliding motility-associated C-terminal domain-containing protein [Bacteroidales bacterium]|nr:gliding motility-associated C-terminal domain-containing protein [Bacteroidales bacterium]
MNRIFIFSCLLLFGLSIGRAQDSLRIVTKITTQITCPDDSNGIATVFAADGSGAYTYKWSNGDITDIADSLSYGWYYVTVNDTMPTIRIDSVFIFADSIITVFKIDKDTVCGDDSSSGIEINNYMYGPFIYLWNTGSAENIIDSLRAGTYLVTITDSRGCVHIDSVKIDSVARRASNAIITDATALGINDGIWSINTSGGILPVSYFTEKEYEWYDTAILSFNTAIGNSLPPGIYHTTVNDRFCSISFHDTINESDPLIIDYSGIDSTACKNETATSAFVPINGITPMYSIFETDTTIWLTGDTLPDGTPITEFNANAPGAVYPGRTNQVKIGDSLGREFYYQWIVVEPENYITILESEYNNVTCHSGNDGDATVAVQGGFGNYTYTIQSIGNTGNIVTGLTADNYTWIIYDENGCNIIKEFTIYEPDPIQGQLEKTDVRCYDEDNGIIVAYYSGGEDTLLYSWSNGETSKRIDSLLAGTYRLTLTDANGCIFEDSIVITEPDSLYISLDTIIFPTCFEYNNGSIDVNINGGISRFDYNWYMDSLRFSQETEDIRNLFAGIYFLEVRDSNNCSDTSTFIVTEPPRIQYNILQKNEIQCNDSTGDIIITSPVNLNFIWEGTPVLLNDTFSINNLTAGQYTIRMQDLTGCFIDTMIVFNQPLPININAQVTGVNCFGENTGSIVIYVNGGSPGNNFTFNWSNGSTNDFLNGLYSGTYNVTVTDTFTGCEAYHSIAVETIFQEPIYIMVDSVKPSCRDSINNGELRVTDWRNIFNPSFTWMNINGDSIGEGAVLRDLYSGTYILQTRDINNCERIDSLYLTYEDLPCIGLYNVITPNGDSPNDTWIIDRINLFPDCEVKIYDQYNLIFESVGYDQPWDGRDGNGELVSPGSYFYEIILHRNDNKPYLGVIEVIY